MLGVNTALQLFGCLLVTCRGTLLMETRLLHDYFGNFSTPGERYYFFMEGSMRGEIEPM